MEFPEMTTPKCGLGRYSGKSKHKQTHLLGTTTGKNTFRVSFETRQRFMQ